MATPGMTKDSTEIAWLVFVTVGVVVLSLVAHAIYRDFGNILKSAKKKYSSRKSNRKKKRIIRLLNRRSDEELAKIAFSVAAWPREGFPDRLLYLKRPPHYREDLKSGLHPREVSGLDPEVSLEWFHCNTRENLLSVLAQRMSHRSLATLMWLEDRLGSGGAALENPGEEQSPGFRGRGKIRGKSA